LVVAGAGGFVEVEGLGLGHFSFGNLGYAHLSIGFEDAAVEGAGLELLVLLLVVVFLLGVVRIVCVCVCLCDACA
jgi:hypothetical protein